MARVVNVALNEQPVVAKRIRRLLFRETVASGNPQQGAPGENGMGRLLQGTLENSNVDIVEEMVNMITTQRAYEMNSKVVSAADQMLQYITQTL